MPEDSRGGAETRRGGGSRLDPQASSGARHPRNGGRIQRRDHSVITTFDSRPGQIITGQHREGSLTERSS